MSSLTHFSLSSSQSLVSLREEADSGHKPNQHRAEPHRSGHWWDVQKGLRAQSALHNGRSGHDPTAAQAPRKRQCQGNDSLLPLFSFFNASTLFFILIFIIPAIFCLRHILHYNAVRSHSKHTKEWKVFHWHWWLLVLYADYFIQVYSK